MSEKPNFYRDLTPFKAFEEFTLEENYARVPSDWKVFVTDIKGSTKAIERGEYRSVNLVGAATITVCLRLLKGIEFPYVFGGDGASLCVPPEHAPKVEDELNKLRNLSKTNFGLELRVASIPVADIEREGKQVLVAKFELTENRCIAVFRGGGLGVADSLAKNNYEEYKVSQSNEVIEELAGLSCRWNPIPAKKDKVLSLMVAARDESEKEIFPAVIKELGQILGGGFENANPVHLETMSYKPFWKSVTDEKRYHKSIFSFKFLFRFIEIVFATLVFKVGMPPIVFNKNDYANSMQTHSDSKKFDDTLRLIIDCDLKEITSIRGFLESLKCEGKIFYGIHESDEALMTCYVEDLGQGNHIHFIDGGDGGYAMAAKQMKGQILESLQIHAS